MNPVKKALHLYFFDFYESIVILGVLFFGMRNNIILFSVWALLLLSKYKMLCFRLCAGNDVRENRIIEKTIEPDDILFDEGRNEFVHAKTPVGMLKYYITDSRGKNYYFTIDRKFNTQRIADSADFSGMNLKIRFLENSRLLVSVKLENDDNPYEEGSSLYRLREETLEEFKQVFRYYI